MQLEILKERKVKTVKKTAIKGIIIPNDYQAICDWLDLEATSPGKLQKDLIDADGDDVQVEINSPGGFVAAGSELYNLMHTYSGKLTIDIVGQAASAASVAAMARHNRIAPTASIMIHNVSMDGVSGDYHEMDKASNELLELTKAMANAYVLKTGMDRKSILKMMDAETTLEAQSAVEQGFVDEIIPETDESIFSKATNFSLSKDFFEKLNKLMSKNQPEDADLENLKLQLQIAEMSII